MISFIIPTKNEEKVIEKTLKCLKDYTEPNEIIVSDGKSSDKTIDIAKMYTNDIVIYQGTTRQGISKGKNDGARIAHGDLLLFLDADMFIPDINVFLQKAQENFQKDSELLAMTVSLRVFPEMATWADRLIFGYMNILHKVLNNILRIGAAPGEFQMIRAEAFKKVGGYNEALMAGEDYDMFRRLRKIGRTYCSNDLVCYHTGRRAHAIGWPRLLTQWAMNNLSTVFFKKSVSSEWKEIR